MAKIPIIINSNEHTPNNKPIIAINIDTLNIAVIIQKIIPPSKKINFSFLNIESAKCQQNRINILEIPNKMIINAFVELITILITIITAENITNPIVSFTILSTKKSFSSFSRMMRMNHGINITKVKMYSVVFRIKKSNIIEVINPISIKPIPRTRNKLSFLPLMDCIFFCRYPKLK